jgi:hypothetical protein
MRTLLYRIAFILLLAGTAANAAPNVVPPSEQPGRERYRFEPSPLDRFMQPSQPAGPLLRWDCHEPGTSRAKPRSRRGQYC